MIRTSEELAKKVAIRLAAALAAEDYDPSAGVDIVVSRTFAENVLDRHLAGALRHFNAPTHCRRSAASIIIESIPDLDDVEDAAMVSFVQARASLGAAGEDKVQIRDVPVTQSAAAILELIASRCADATGRRVNSGDLVEAAFYAVCDVARHEDLTN